MSVYVLFQIDVWGTKSSRVFCGVYSSLLAATDDAEKRGLITEQSKAEVIKCEMDKFEEQ